LGKHPCDIGNGTQAIKLAGYKVNNDNLAGVMAFENLRKPKISEYMRILLDSQVLTNEAVDTELAYCLRQKTELPSKIKAIQEFNKLKGRHAPSKNLSVFLNANELLSQLSQATTVKQG
jgi:phage terminase small subunit